MTQQRFAYHLAPLLMTLVLPVLSACGGGGTTPPTPPTPPAPSATYDLRAAVLQLYSKPHIWALKGTVCCGTAAATAALTLQPRPSDGAVVSFGGETVNGVDITLELGGASTTQHLWYSGKGQQMMVNGLADDRIEVTTAQGSLPTNAKLGDSGGNGETSTYYQYPAAPKLLASTSYRWELKSDSAARALLCLNAVETPDAGYAGGNAELAAKTSGGYCFGLNADSSLSGYVTMSEHGYNNNGFDLSTQ